MAIGIVILCFTRIIVASSLAWWWQAEVLVLATIQELEAIVHISYLLDTSVRAPALLNEQIQVGLGVDMWTRTPVRIVRCGDKSLAD